MDPITISTGLVAVFAPLLSFLTGLGGAAANAAAQQAGQSVGKAAMDRATALWDRLWPALRGRDAATQAVATIARDADAEDARAALAGEVARLLRRDPELAREAAAVLAELSGRGTTVTAGDIDVRGTGNVVQLGGSNIAIGHAHDVRFSHDPER